MSMMEINSHECQPLKEYDSSLNNKYLIESDGKYCYGWRFELVKYAAKEAVENGQAEHIGVNYKRL